MLSFIFPNKGLWLYRGQSPTYFLLCSAEFRMHFLKIRPIVVLYRYRRLSVPFREYIQGKCTAGYNYIRQEIIFLNADYRFCYVLGLSFSSWYCRIVDWKYLYNLYPGLLAGDESGRLYDLCSEVQSDMQISVITRPIKLLPDIYKRVSHIALRCSVQRADLVCKVWGAQEAEGRYSLLYRFRIAGRCVGANTNASTFASFQVSSDSVVRNGLFRCSFRCN